MNFRILAFSLAGAVLVSGAHAESADSVLALSTDNDLFAPTQTDRDYTAGVGITYSSNSEEFIGNPVSRVSQGLDGYVLPFFGGQVGKPQTTALEFGVGVQGWPDFVTRQPLQSRIDGLWRAGARGIGTWWKGELLLGRNVSQSPRLQRVLARSVPAFGP